jgi:glycosyltransferase involved in cell wall biosynthesis
MGGGVGTVIRAWVDNDKHNVHEIMLLDSINDKSMKWADANGVSVGYNKSNWTSFILAASIAEADVVVLHYWDHPMMKEFTRKDWPECRMVAWCHKNVEYSREEIGYPDVWVDTSPVQGNSDRWIWSTGDMKRFLEVERKDSKRFNVGVVLSPKIHPVWFDWCEGIRDAVPNEKFIILGEFPDVMMGDLGRYYYTGKVDDVAPYFAWIDLLLYPLRDGHYGTCEQVIGEAMCAGVQVKTTNNPAEAYIMRQTGNTREGAARLYNINNTVKQWNELFEAMMKQDKRKREVLQP